MITRILNSARPYFQVQMRAFDWIDLVLYAFAIFYLVPAALMAAGLVPLDWFDYGVGRSFLTDHAMQEQQAAYRLPLIFTVFFSIFVYLRNYMVMHQIDSRRSYEIKAFAFVNNNKGGFYFLERVFRAGIILWVLTSGYGYFAPVTDFIILLRTAALPASANEFLPFCDFLTYYCVVIFGLYLLCIAYDLVNVVSVSWAIKKDTFSAAVENYLEIYEAFRNEEVPDFYDTSFTEMVKSHPEIYSIVNYINPKIPGLGKSTFDPEDTAKKRLEKYNRKSKNMTDRLTEGKIPTMYFYGAKFRERIFGMATVTILFYTALHQQNPDSAILINLSIIASIITMTVYIFSLGLKEFVPTWFVFPRYALSYFFDNRKDFG